MPSDSCAAEERYLLRCALVCTTDDLAFALDTIKPRDFEEVRYAEVWRGIGALVSNGATDLDAGLVASELRRSGFFDRLGVEADWWMSIVRDPVDARVSMNMRTRVASLRDASVRRRLREAAASIVEEAGNYERHPEVIGWQGARSIMDIANEANDEAIPTMQDLMQRLEHRFSSPYDPDAERVATGYADIDSMLDGGLSRGGLTILAARPSMGKSSLAINFMLRAARAGKRVLFLSTEVSSELVSVAMVSSDARVLTSRLLRGHVEPQDMEAVRDSASWMRKAAITIVDQGPFTPARLRTLLRTARVQQQPYDLCVVDYINMLRPDEGTVPRGANLNAVFTELSHALQTIARDEPKTALVVLAQLNRQVEQRQEKKPQLSDLRESGSIEQFADVVMMLWRDEYYDPSNTEVAGLAKLNIAKNRHGRTGLVRLRWFAEYRRFEGFVALTESMDAEAQGSGRGKENAYAE